MFALVARIRAVFGHLRGLFALNAGRLTDAERHLKAAVAATQLFPNPLRIESCLLLAETLHRLARRGEAVDLFRNSLAEMQRSPDYSVDDENYIGSYFSRLLQLSEEAQFQDFDVNSVKKPLRRDFPLSVRSLDPVSR
jgi:hypothetical protein